MGASLPPGADPQQAEAALTAVPPSSARVPVAVASGIWENLRFESMPERMRRPSKMSATFQSLE